MKAELTNSAMRVNPRYRDDAAAAARAQRVVYSVPQYIEAPAGTIISGPESYMLVRMGMAKPADDECRIRCGMTDTQIAAAALAQEKVSKGIHPDDYDRYDSGEILGYNPDGSYIPGPNWDGPDQEDDDE